MEKELLGMFSALQDQVHVNPRYNIFQISTKKYIFFMCIANIYSVKFSYEKETEEKLQKLTGFSLKKRKKILYTAFLAFF